MSMLGLLLAALVWGVSCLEVQGQDTSFWYANMDHTGPSSGLAPDLDSKITYPVYVAVAPGDGAGIQRAINDAGDGSIRHGQWLASQPRVRIASLNFMILVWYLVTELRVGCVYTLWDIRGQPDYLYEYRHHLDG